MIIALEMQPPTQPPMHCGKDLKASYLGCLSFPACKASCIGVDRVRAWKFKVVVRKGSPSDCYTKPSPIFRSPI